MTRSKKGVPSSTAPIFIALFVALCATFVLSLCIGRYTISPGDIIAVFASYFPGADSTVSAKTKSVVEALRLPRIIAAVLVGAALAVAGSTYQGLFQNPLVSPDILGVSSGACVGAAIAILGGLSSGGIQVLAFAGGIVAVICTMFIPRLMQSTSILSLVLSGVIVSGFMSSITGLLKYLADTNTQLPDIVYWQLGSLTKVGYDDLAVVRPIIIVAGAVLLLTSWRVNLLSLGEKEARSLGVCIKAERGIAIVASTLLTASAVCLSGTIGWIGLVVPHIARRLVGSDNTKVLPASAIIAAIFLLIIDTLSRTLTGSEIPLGILTGIVGAPFFAFILIKNRQAK